MFIPDPNFFHPGSRFLIKEFKYFNPKIVSKLSEISSGLLIPDLDPNFLPIPDPGVIKAPDPVSWTLLHRYLRRMVRSLTSALMSLPAAYPLVKRMDTRHSVSVTSRRTGRVRWGGDEERREASQQIRIPPDPLVALDSSFEIRNEPAKQHLLTLGRLLPIQIKRGTLWVELL